MCAMQSERLGPGITFHEITDTRFKTNKISIHLITPLVAETAAANALIPSLLRKGYDEMADFTAFHRHLDGLYGAEVLFGVEKSGDQQILSLSMMGIDDRYTMEQQPLTEQLSTLLWNLLLRPPLLAGQFAASEVAIEQATLVDAIESQRNDKRSYALSTAMRLMCAGEPFGLCELGTVEQARALTPEQITKQYHHLLQTARLEVMFVGCGDAQIARRVSASCVKEMVRCATAGEIAATKVHPIATTTAEEIERMDLMQSKMVLGFSSGIAVTDADMAALRLFCMVFGGTPTSKLFVNVREKLSLCYYCAARVEKSKGIVRVDCGVERDNIEKAKTEILRQLELLQRGEVTEQEYQESLLSATNSFQTVGDSLHGLEGYYLDQILQHTAHTPEMEIAALQGVTIGDLVAVSRKLHLDLVYLLTDEETNP